MEEKNPQLYIMIGELISGQHSLHEKFDAHLKAQELINGTNNTRITKLEHWKTGLTAKWAGISTAIAFIVAYFKH